MSSYIILGLAWIAFCLLIGYYITSSKENSTRHFKIGLYAIGISYLLGLSLLFIILLIH